MLGAIMSSIIRSSAIFVCIVRHLFTHQKLMLGLFTPHDLPRQVWPPYLLACDVNRSWFSHHVTCDVTKVGGASHSPTLATPSPAFTDKVMGRIRKLMLQIIIAKTAVINYLYVFGATALRWAMASTFTRFLDHTQRRTTVRRTPLD